jgi:hypothetical protein
VAAQVSEMDKAYGHDLVLFNPLKNRTEISSSAAFRFQLNRLRCPELLPRLHCGISINHMN